MAHLALYRQTRPRRFSALIGQEHVAATLKNQVKHNHLSHAYLFCGTRGTGKTSAAKILANAVNCLEPDDGEPCGHCALCALTENPDIFEIDAASNNGVDQIRDLREKVRFAPLESRFKVYIIDEVHMLSSGAFNALLKTLEEPPSHVIFILATTEPQKLPATILSRCQRFDFKRISPEDIEHHLAAVLDGLGSSYEPRALQKIALLADGGMRDAMSLADQCLSFGEGHISYELVLRALGSADDSQRFLLVDAILRRDIPAALVQLDHMLSMGQDMAVLCRDMGAHFRALALICACHGEAQALLHLAQEEYQALQQQAKAYPLEFLMYATETFAQAEAALRRAAQPRLHLEMALLRVCQPENQSSWEALCARVALLEQQLTSQGASQAMEHSAPAPPPSAEKNDNTPSSPPENATVFQNANAEAVQFTNRENDDIPAASLSAKTGDQSQADCLFESLQASQGEGIKQIFKMYRWNTQLQNGTLYIQAPPACLPALLQTLRSKETAFTEALQQQSPGLQVRFAAATDPLLPGDANALASPEKKAASLAANARQLFGEQVVQQTDSQ